MKLIATVFITLFILIGYILTPIAIIWQVAAKNADNAYDWYRDL